MKLSDAIRLGAMLRPQGFGKGESNRNTCALQAALEAMNDPRFDRIIGCADGAEAQWPWLKTADCVCPECNLPRHYAWHPVPGTISHLNDQHKWTRERIADWVATIEPQDSPTEEVQPCEPRSQEVPT